MEQNINLILINKTTKYDNSFWSIKRFILLCNSNCCSVFLKRRNNIIRTILLCNKTNYNTRISNIMWYYVLIYHCKYTIWKQQRQPRKQKNIHQIIYHRNCNWNNISSNIYFYRVNQIKLWTKKDLSQKKF